MTSMSLGADAQEVKANVLEFIEKYGCEVAPDEAFDALAHKIFAFQFAITCSIARIACLVG